MNILETILSAQNGGAVRQIGNQLGLNQSQTASALTALLPALAVGFQKNLQGAGGVEGLTRALASGNHGRYLDDPAALADASTVSDGNGILSHVFGSKEVSRTVAVQASQQTGISPDLLKKMLPIAAALMMGTMSRQRAASPAGAAAASPDFLSMLSPLMDANRDGSMMDDVAGLVGRFLGGPRH